MLLALIFIYSLITIGVSYSYYAYREEESVAITGNVVAIDADLDIELVSGNNRYMVPMNNDALSNAINGVGSSNGACIDSAGNLSCQVYKITLTNNGSRLQHLRGSIELYAKTGNGNVYNNLKWKELTNPTTLKSDAVVNSMDKSTLVSNLTIESKEIKTWYIAVWISEVDSDQTNTDKGAFGGTVTFETVTNVITETILKPNAQSDASIDFSKTSASTNTNGIYLRSGTENDDNPIYYYRGNVNNNLIFADTCWKIVRTTETGGLKLIYNGVPSNGQCNNTGSSSQIGTKAFNSSYNSPAYVGYMYGDVYTSSVKSMSSTDNYVYGNSVTYAGGSYTLTDTVTNGWSSLYNGGLNNNHYTCFTTGNTCSSVYYIYYTSSSAAKYITLTGGKKVEDALTDMLDKNTNSSTIKGNNTTEGTLDYWYYTNIEQKGYSSYIEDTVWCNDRSVYQIGGWNPDGGSTRSYLWFRKSVRIENATFPTLTCSRNIDKFTVSNSNGNGDLDYPVGLLTIDEIVLTGGNSTSNILYYLYSGESYWIISSYGYNFNDGVGAGAFFVNNYGNIQSAGVSNNSGVRPSISLASGFSLSTSSGDGTGNSPFIVE